MGIEYGREIEGALRIRNTPDYDDLIRQKLSAHGWLPVLYDDDPAYNPDTHYVQLSGTYTVTQSDITLHKEIIERTEEDKTVIADAKQRVQDIKNYLPSWAQVENAVDNISNLAEAKTFIKKMARVVYWCAKNTSV